MAAAVAGLGRGWPNLPTVTPPTEGVLPDSLARGLRLRTPPRLRDNPEMASGNPLPHSCLVRDFVQTESAGSKRKDTSHLFYEVGSQKGLLGFLPG